ncbi:MAG: hydrogenase [Deltaproteobacteria bacterium]|nr:hydrogenase [Deltaproteobacteria bacterium]
MIWLLCGIVLMGVSGLAGLIGSRARDGGQKLACALILVGVTLCLPALLKVLAPTATVINWRWAVPGGQFLLELDAISAAFILPLLLVVALGAIYGLGYWRHREHPANATKLQIFYGLISAAMIVLLLARNSLLFLMAWEVMALAGYFLITTEDHKPEVCRAGFIYLIATHSGTLALFGAFALLGTGQPGALSWPAAASFSSPQAGLIFILALFGFGMKAGLMPLHIWLPGAHAAAPSHASALLSGVMIKTGIYGLVRLTSFFAEIPAWWGWTLLLLGVVSGIFGVALAIAQHDIKRLLAYHSVENIGIIALGLGLALLGRSYNQPTLVVLGLAGCLLHVANHGLFKSLLFLSAGSMIHGVGTREIDQYGGLLKRQPLTGLFFLGGAVAICGLPPFNGFISEWLIYLASFKVLNSPSGVLSLSLLTAPALALIGGLALACFVKVFGISFGGEPRTAAAASAHEAPATMLWPMGIFLLACAFIGLLPSQLAPLLNRAAAQWQGQDHPLPLSLGGPLAPLAAISLAGWILVVLLALVFWRLRRCSQGARRDLGTWGCGYPFPSPKMQYTASSFGDSLVRLFNFGLWSKRHGGRPDGLFPATSSFESHTPDLFLDRLFSPAFQGAAWLMHGVRRLIQNGVAAIYLLYSALTLLVLLALLTR